VCRCDDVRLERHGGHRSAREAKLATRAGMGPCQGRICGPACSFLFGWEADGPRLPVEPTALGNLLTTEEPLA
jgi:hypothetical protein